MTEITNLVARANARGPTSGFTDADDDHIQLPDGFDRSKAKLFTPLRVGAFTLSHRVVHAALGRSRCANGKESPLAAEYFSQRVTPGSLVISQATGTSEESTAWPFSALLQTEAQIAAFEHTIKAVHANGAIWFHQLNHVGRCTSPALVQWAHVRAGVPKPYYGYLPVSSSAIGETGINTHSGEPFGTPHPLNIEEIKSIIQDFKQTAQNAVKAGADGIEILSGNGFLLDQFLHDNINQRTDEYGGSVENRARLTLEVVDAISDIVSYQKIGVRLSPFSNFHETDGSNPLEQSLYLCKELAKRGVAYIHIGEPRVSRNLGIEENLKRLAEKGIAPEDISLRQFRKLVVETRPVDVTLHPTVLFGVGGYTATTALLTVEQDLADAVVFGRRFISNPDLVRRIRYGYSFSKYDRDTFYTHGAKGYIDYENYDGPVSEEETLKLKRTGQVKGIKVNGDANNAAAETNGINTHHLHGHGHTSTPNLNKHPEEEKSKIILNKLDGEHENRKSKKVAIIGAGVSGIVSASAFDRVGGFQVQIFERNGIPGGSWIMDLVSSSVPVFPADAPEIINPPVSKPSGATLPFTSPRHRQQRFRSSPIYEALYSNIPRNIMSDLSTFNLPHPSPKESPYLPGRVIGKSVEATARQFDDRISYHTTVENVEKLVNGKLRLLLRRENSDNTDLWYEEEFDHLIVATGHNSVPRVPSVPGLQSWKRGLRHTVTWRSPLEFKDKRILVVGSSESAIDVVTQSLPFATGPICVSQKSLHPRFPTIFERPGVKVLPTIDHLTETEIHFTNGEVLTDIDIIVFATGYFYTHPFLSEKIRPKTNGYRIPGLYQHIFDTFNLDSIAFIGVATATLSWATWEKSAFVVALYWSGKISLPPIEEQERWEERRAAKYSDRWFHYLATTGERVIYWDEINELAGDYLNTRAMDDDLLRSFPFEWVLESMAGLLIKKKFYGIENTK